MYSINYPGVLFFYTGKNSCRFFYCSYYTNYYVMCSSLDLVNHSVFYCSWALIIGDSLDFVRNATAFVVGCSPWTKEFKDTKLKCRLYWSFRWGWWSNFVGSESGQKQSGPQHNSTPAPLPPQPHPVCINCTFSMGRGEGGGRSERR